MRLGIDIGGTFTDFVLFDEETGTFLTHKILSTPNDPAQAVLEGQAALPIKPPLYVIHGSTVATNALLERKGSKREERNLDEYFYETGPNYEGPG